MATARCAIHGLLLVTITGYLWLRSLAMSLWLDETVTYWIVAAPFDVMLSRAMEYQFSSLYFALIWPVLHVGLPHTELVLRLPSLAACAAATWFVYRTASRLLDREAGLVAAIAFTTQSVVVYAATEARFYGIGLLTVTAAMFFHLRFAERPDRLRDGLIGVALACLAVHVHPIFALLLPIQAMGIVGLLASERLPKRHAAILAGVALVLLLPWLPVAARLLAHRDSLSWARPPTPLDLIAPVAVPAVLFLAVRGSCFARVLRGTMRRIGLAPSHTEVLRPGARASSALLALWCLLPPLVLYAVSATTGSQLFVPRYLSTTAPALAILLAGVVCIFLRPRARVVASLLLALSAPFRVIPLEQLTVDWRRSAATVRALSPSQTTPVFFHSGLIESSQIAWLTDPKHAGYLLAPLVPYPHGGRILPLPFRLDSPEAVGYLASLYDREASDVDRFIVAGRYPLWFRRWFERRASPYAMRQVGNVLVFERRKPRG